MSSFEEDKVNGDDAKETTDFMKEVSSIMSETNLLESDDDEEKYEQNFKNNKILENLEDPNEQANKLKMLKQSNNLNLDSLYKDKIYSKVNPQKVQ